MPRDHRAFAAELREDAELLRSMASALDRRAAAHERRAEAAEAVDDAVNREAARAALHSAAAVDRTATFI